MEDKTAECWGLALQASFFTSTMRKAENYAAGPKSRKGMQDPFCNAKLYPYWGTIPAVLHGTPPSRVTEGPLLQTQSTHIKGPYKTST
eukprot:754994-Hanusia_phi.AAC.7